ncbi:rhamnan synthesis F family protein [Schaalia hyovaginalis]|uniref:rhamnan synthesis F family protein n=1 Tax=Schaalia hyovaginalis TaxID=29316 RepID=UPI0026ECC087|nr:rhamnan synthesis F family protein [Schaalia hyovaginalis]MCI6557656.1 rhamnan synthesis F family protein [Schaalia hyovaginalis]MCI7513175.1 rhamnan synthesis F family protein [Schaalia hyovaginalis]MDD7553273.1 rhamnan synthesis F family protein [Schaalia hyovaginalis]MDY3094751.1 rhamnan synthesis F family protein [Schaalia hyovaginalis]
MILEDSARRLGVFFFYDAQGAVDDYVRVLLAGMRPCLDELIVVVNGRLNAHGRERLSEWADDLIVRENKGLDVWAYKTALDSRGWEDLLRFDEIVLFNSTIMGPVHPFTEMFDEMGRRDVDFWGITGFHEVPAADDAPAAAAIPAHIQSHFHVYRRSLVSSAPFQEYWDTMPAISGYAASVSLHEKPFTKRFEDLGFSWDLYVDTRDLIGFTSHPIIFAPKRLIAEKRCPIFKRRSFFHDYEDVLDQSVGNAALDLYEYLRDETDFDTGLIWQNLLRTCELTDLVKNLQLTYVLPTRSSAVEPKGRRLALIMHIHYMELLDQMLHYAASMPDDADIIITVGSEEKADTVRAAVEGLANTVIVRTIVNRGRDVSALLVGARELVLDYDLVCFIHDKKVTQIDPGTVGEGFALKCFENVLPTGAFVENVLALFDREPKLGVLTPAPPNHADYFPISSYAWGPNLPRTKQLLAELGVNVPIHEPKGIMAPLGSTFWFRPAAVRALFEKEWTYEDFPEEPLAGDGTISHAIERSYCYVAQSAGYFSGWLFSDRFARIELTNLAFYTRELTRAIAPHWSLGTEKRMVGAAIANSSAWRILREGVKRRLPAAVTPPARFIYRVFMKTTMSARRWRNGQ